MVARVAINGLGRIGRATLRAVLEEPELDVIAINDLAPLEDLRYLLSYDTVYGRFDKPVRVADRALVIAETNVAVFAEADPARLPWRALEIDLVFEATGAFRRHADLAKHLEAGARRVLLSAPARDDIPTVVYGVNTTDADVVSCASCTTNCIAPVMEVLERHVGVHKATMTTVHAYTSSQALIDGPAPHRERGRAAAANIVPTTTGAAQATSVVLPPLQGRFDGIALRVPIPVGSIADIVALTRRATSVDELTNIFGSETTRDRYRDVLGVSADPIVSSDIVGDPRAAVVDLSTIQVIDHDLVKIMAWYDNEWGYTQQMVRQALRMLHTPNRPDA